MGRFLYGGNRTYTMILLLLVITLFVSGSLTGCGKSAYQDSIPEISSSNQASSEEYGSDSDINYKEFTSGAAVSDQERKVVQNAGMVLSVRDVSQAMDKIINIAADYQGYTVNSNLKRGDDWVRGEVEVKVPSPQLNAVMEEVAALGEIKDKSLSAQDVTEEYYDSQARLAVLNKKEERLLALMDRAQTIEEIISVENELTRARSDIEVLSGRLKYLENATSYSSLSVSLSQASATRVEVPEGILAKALQAFINSINNLAQFLSGFFILFIALIPWALLLGMMIWIFGALKKKYNWGFKRKQRQVTLPAVPEADEDKQE